MVAKCGCLHRVVLLLLKIELTFQFSILVLAWVYVSLAEQSARSHDVEYQQHALCHQLDQYLLALCIFLCKTGKQKTKVHDKYQKLYILVNSTVNQNMATSFIVFSLIFLPYNRKLYCKALHIQ